MAMMVTVDDFPNDMIFLNKEDQLVIQGVTTAAHEKRTKTPTTFLSRY
jgi:hypothetical protein